MNTAITALRPIPAHTASDFSAPFAPAPAPPPSDDRVTMHPGCERSACRLCAVNALWAKSGSR